MEYGKTKVRQIVFVLLLMVMILAVGRTARADTKPDTVDFWWYWTVREQWRTAIPSI